MFAVRVYRISTFISGEDVQFDTDLLHLKELGLQYGYPIDAFGNMFPTFTVENEGGECDTNYNEIWYFHYLAQRCRYAIAIVHGTFGATKYIERKNSIHFDTYIGEDHSANKSLPATWTNDIYTIGKIFMPVYLQNDIYPARSHSEISGLLTSKRLKKIISALNECIPKLVGRVNPLRLRPLACGYTEFLSSLFGKINFGDGKESILIPPVDNRTLSSLFWFLFCKHTWSSVIRRLGVNGLEYNYHPSCPNPCARYHDNPCLGRPNVFQLKKVIVDRTDERQDRFFGAQICRQVMDPHGLPGYASMSNQAYECICKTGYRWSNQTRSCVLVNGCEQELTCDPRGTRICISSVTTITSIKALPFTCLCHPGFMGPRCEKKRDACIENENPEQMSGNQACRVFLGNTCEPRIGTNFYTCYCGGLFTSDKMVSFPNCFLRKPICSSVICHRGDCVASKDQLNYICVCQMGWRGRHCEIPDIRMWLPWEGWSGCSAAVCTGLGWRHRIRHCRANLSKLEEEGVDKGLCEGEATQRQLCKATCPAAITPYLLCLRIIVVFCLGCVILVVAVGMMFLRVRVEVE
nr:EGF region [Hymenolepis microstoma]